MDDEKDIIKCVTSEQLEAEMLRRDYCNLLKQSEIYPSEVNWMYIIEHKMEGIGELLYRKYLISYLLPEDKRSEYHNVALREFPRYLEAVERRYAVRVVYSDIHSSQKATTDLIYNGRLFDAQTLRRRLSAGEIDFVVDQLMAFQPTYTLDDLKMMRALYMELLNLPEKGAIQDKRVVFSIEKRFVCQEGHVNNPDEEYCKTCGRNIQGLTAEQVDTINSFGNRLDALEDLLN
jgi:hypothetical protein